MSNKKGPLEGKLAFVTGASRGIGRAIALRLARDGAIVGVHFNSSEEPARTLVSQITQTGGEAFLIAGNLSSVMGVAVIVEGLRVNLRGRPLDILVNNAGKQLPEGIEADQQTFDELFAVNIKAPFFLIQKLSTLLADGGRVINISSGLSRIAYPEKMVYAMTKAAMNSMTLSFAKHFGTRSITVNAVLPGIIATDMNAWVQSPEAAAQVAARSVLNRVGQPDDVAGIVALLAAPECGWVTGELIEASGGARLVG